MCEGQIHSFNSGIEWRSRGESMRLNTEKGLSKMLYGDRIEAYRCEHCKKILISYDLLIVMQDIVLRGSTGSKVKIKE